MTDPTEPSRDPSSPPFAGRPGTASEEPHEPVHEPVEEGLQGLMADLHHRIEVAAYYLAERRGFASGYELDDWLAAEDAIEAEDAARWSED